LEENGSLNYKPVDSLMYPNMLVPGQGESHSGFGRCQSHVWETKPVDRSNIFYSIVISQFMQSPHKEHLGVYRFRFIK